MANYGTYPSSNAYTPWDASRAANQPYQDSAESLLSGMRNPTRAGVTNYGGDYSMASYGNNAAFPTAMPSVGAATTATPVVAGATGLGGLGDLFSDAWNKAGDLGNGITNSMKGFNKWGQDTGLLGNTKMVDGKEVRTDGWGGLALGGAKGIFDAYNSMQTFGLAKEMFESQKHFANANLQNGQKSYNTQIEGRHRAMADGNRNVESTDSYMAKHRLG